MYLFLELIYKIILLTCDLNSSRVTQFVGVLGPQDTNRSGIIF